MEQFILSSLEWEDYFLVVAAFSVIAGGLYAMLLNALESGPVKQRWVLLETIGGVLICFTLYVLFATVYEVVYADDALLMIITVFSGVGVPISIWQIEKYWL